VKKKKKRIIFKLIIGREICYRDRKRQRKRETRQNRKDMFDCSREIEQKNVMNK
jgi:hypothetical protein